MDSVNAGINITQDTVRELIRKCVECRNRSACVVKSVSAGVSVILFCISFAELKH